MSPDPNKPNANPDNGKPKQKPLDYFLWCEITPRTGWLVLFACLICGILLPTISQVRAKSPSVVIYTSQDEEYADPIFKDFEKQTGIQVRAVYDSEAVKTVGLANRLLAERNHPQCDVFWNNEELRTRLLAAQGIFRETNGWSTMGYRTRRLVVNTNLLSLARAPHSFSEATNEMWRGKVALAYPLFGTTAAHFQALRQQWGDERWQNWCRALAANKPMIVDGNSVVVKLVGAGEASFGFTDSDDIAGAQREGLPVAALPLNDESLLIHNTVGVLRGAPHPSAAQQLFEYLQSKPVMDRMLTEHALESTVSDESTTQPGLKVNWEALLHDLDSGTAEAKGIFLR
ncbi:MAG: Extracellular solute-binding protein family 1 [Pedosphaera sp.]|nr:Extracellular solute-binding protein family 1 [Pedosphaera sp.]